MISQPGWLKGSRELFLLGMQLGTSRSKEEATGGSSLPARHLTQLPDSGSGWRSGRHAAAWIFFKKDCQINTKLLECTKRNQLSLVFVEIKVFGRGWSQGVWLDFFFFKYRKEWNSRGAVCFPPLRWEVLPAEIKRAVGWVRFGIIAHLLTSLFPLL